MNGEQGALSTALSPCCICSCALGAGHLVPAAQWHFLATTTGGKKKKKAQENCPAPRDSRLCYQQVWGSTASQQLSFLLVCLYLTRRAGDRRRLSSVLKLEPVLLGGSDPISLQRIRVWHSQSVVHIGSVSAELFLTTKNISGRVTVCCNHIFPVFLCDNYSHKYHCFTSAQ